MRMPSPLTLHEDRLFPPDPKIRGIARELYAAVRDLPIVSPHGHTDPAWFALNEPFGNAAELLLQPDHYLFRMLYSQGVRLEDLGIGEFDEARGADPRAAWRILAENFHLFQGTPSRIWLDWVFAEVFGLATSTRSPRRCNGTNFVRARCSSGSISKSSPPPKARSTRCRTIARSARAIGRAGLSPRTGPIR
jgi:hypothetical protein